MPKYNWDDPLPPAKWENQTESPEKYWARRLLETRGNERGRFLLGENLTKSEPFYLETSNLETHLHLVGASGVGKSYFLEALLKTLILQGFGFTLIDPHGSLYHNLIDFCTALNEQKPHLNLSKRIIPVDIAEKDYYLGFNPVARNSRVMTYQVVALMEVIRKCWGAGSFQETPRLARWLFNAAYALIDAEATLVQMQDLLSPSPNELQYAITKRIKNPRIKQEWEWLLSLKPDKLGEYTESSFNRTRQFGIHEVLKLILGQKTNTIDFPAILKENRVLLVNLARQNTISEDDQHLIGTLLVNELVTAAFARPEEQRKKAFFLAIDEFSHFVTKDICEILDGGRKFGLHLVLAHQHLNQLKLKDPEVYFSALTNARSKVVFGGMNDEDLEILSKELYTGELNPDEIKDEVWQTKFRPVETTRTVTVDSWSETTTEGSSESTGVSDGESLVTNTSLAEGQNFIPGSDFWQSDELASTSKTNSTSDSRSYTTSTSKSSSSSSSTSSSKSGSSSEVPFYEYHEFKELSSRTFRTLEEQLYIKKAQLKRQARQHAAVLIPDQKVILIKTGTLKDFSKVITKEQKENFLKTCFRNSGYFKTLDEAKKEVEGLEKELLDSLIIKPNPRPTPEEAKTESTGSSTKGKQTPKNTPVIDLKAKDTPKKGKGKAKPSFFDTIKPEE